MIGTNCVETSLLLKFNKLFCEDGKFFSSALLTVTLFKKEDFRNSDESDIQCLLYYSSRRDNCTVMYFELYNREDHGFVKILMLSSPISQDLKVDVSAYAVLRNKLHTV